MTISEQKRRELEGRGTAGSSLVTVTALSLALTLGQYSVQAVPIVEPEDGHVRLAGTGGTASQPLSLEFTELDVFKQINRVYDDLLRSQVELDADARSALYANLWDLYA